MTIHIRDIELSKLVPSKANVRRTGRSERIEELAASISAHGLLQNLTVRPDEGDKFEVIAGGRRLAALKLLVKRKTWAKDAPVPCQIVEGENVTEISLAENALQCPMHPADQFEAFAELQRQDMSIEDIAARFGVAPSIVMQRLKLGAVSKKLMSAYRAGEINLDQLSAFAITDDHKRQEEVWKGLGYDRSRHAILEALNEGHVSSDDRRALYVGEEAYVAAGGHITRDLFDEDGGGFFDDAAMLNRLAGEKLATEAQVVSAEGWKWVETAFSFDYGQTSGMRRIHPAPRELTDVEQGKIDALLARCDALCDEMGEEEDSDLQKQLDACEQEIDAIRGMDIYALEEIAIAGVFVTLNGDGSLRIERGFVRREDDPGKGKAKEPENGNDKAKDGLSAKLMAELTAYRTAALANELAQQPHLALMVLTHALAGDLFYRHSGIASCARVTARQVYLGAYAKDIEDNIAVVQIDKRHAAWQARMPEAPAALWDFIVGLPDNELMELIAHCVSLTLDAVYVEKSSGCDDLRRNADELATALSLDMAAYWQPTAKGYFSRVSKERILSAVSEGVSKEAAENLASLKKQALAEAAEQRLQGRGWLPEPLRNPA